MDLMLLLCPALWMIFCDVLLLVFNCFFFLCLFIVLEFSAQAELFARYRAEFEATLARRNERSVGADSVAILGHEVSELKTRVQSSVVHTRVSIRLWSCVLRFR